MSESQPLDYSGSSSSARPPQSPKERRQRLWMGFGVGLFVSCMSAASFFGLHALGLAVIILGVKAAAMLIGLFIRDWRMFAVGLLFSSLLVLLVFLGTCAVIVAGIK